MANREGRGTCKTCDNEDVRVWLFGENLYCSECVINSVITQVGNTDEPGTIDMPWPPRLEKEHIPMDVFQDFMTNEQWEKYRESDRWRSVTNPANRIRCRWPATNPTGGPFCNGWVGGRTAWSANVRHEPAPCLYCFRDTCLRCGRPLDGSNEAQPEGECTQTEEMLAIEADKTGPNRGSVYQLCPKEGCEARIELREGCNEMVCTCWTVFCFLCGRAESEVGPGHWANGAGCVRFPNSGIYDIAYYNHVNHDTHYFEPLQPGGNDRLRDAADTIAQVDNEHRVRQHGDYGLREDDEDNFLNDWMQRLVVASRHILAMLHNGIEYGGSDSTERQQSVLRRLRFEHHGLYFRYAFRVLWNRFEEELQLPGGNVIYEDVRLYSRRLRFRINAVPLLPADRREQWRAFRAIVEDQLNIQYSAEYLVDAGDDQERQRALFSRTLLEPVRRMLVTVEHNWERRNFTLADSAIIRRDLRTLQSSLRTFDRRPNEMSGFISLGQEQTAVYQLANLFANNLFEDDDETEDEWDRTALGELHFSATWTEQILDALVIETRNLHVDHPHQAPARIPALYSSLTAIVPAIASVLSPPEGIETISDHELTSMRKRTIGDGYVERDQITIPGTNISVNQVNTGRGPPRPLFLRMIDIMRSITQNAENMSREISSARSSLSMNASNTLADDIGVIDNDLHDARDRAIHILPDDDDPEAVNMNNRLRMGISIMDRLCGLGIRLSEPGLHSLADGQAIFDHLDNKDDLYQQGGSLDYGFGGIRRERHTLRILHRMVERAVNNDETNHDRHTRANDLETLIQHIQATSAELDGVPDRAYVEAIRQQLVVDYELWDYDHGQRIKRLGRDQMAWLEDLRFLIDVRSILRELPERLRNPQQLTEMQEHQDWIRDHPFVDTLIGQHGDWERLVRIVTEALQPLDVPAEDG